VATGVVVGADVGVVHPNDDDRLVENSYSTKSPGLGISSGGMPSARREARTARSPVRRTPGLSTAVWGFCPLPDRAWHRKRCPVHFGQSAHPSASATGCLS
jgi:hypothetical protein